MKALGAEADLVLEALADVYALRDVQSLCDRVCQCVVRLSNYRLALLSLYFGEDVYIGLEGGSTDLRERFFETASTTPPEVRHKKRAQIWSNHRIPGTDLCFIPAGSEVHFGPSFTPSPAAPGAEWHPEDRLMLFVRGAQAEVHGVLSLDQPADGRRPDPNDLGSLRAVDRFMKLMGVQIHNRHLARKLQESEERYAAVVEQGHDGMLIARGERILFANRRLAEMVGVDPPDLVDRTVASLLGPTSEPTLPGEEEGVLRRDDGSSVDVNIRRSNLRFGDASATLVAMADISERKRVFGQLVRAQKMESVGTLASGVAHDFNNLLGGIMGYASLLRLRLGTAHEFIHYVDGIEKASERASELTRQLLGIVRDQEFRVAPVAVGKVVEEVSRFLTETIDPGIEIVTRVAGNLPPVLGDETQIHQVLLNVCLNARDAMPDGGSLALDASPIVTPGGTTKVCISVRDTGSGIDPEVLSRIFDPFYTTKEAGQGTGLGLYLAYRIVQRHGGTVDVASLPGQGTTVEILLPAHSSRATQRDAAESEQEPARGGLVLVVDDEELMRNVAREMLHRLGYETVAAADGRASVDAVRARPGEFLCVLMDVAMPVMDGWEASQRIHEIDPDLPVVISSGHDVAESIHRTAAGVHPEMLVKPYGLDRMREVLATVPDRG